MYVSDCLCYMVCILCVIIVMVLLVLLCFVVWSLVCFSHESRIAHQAAEDVERHLELCQHEDLENFTSQNYDMFLRSFCWNL